MTNKNKTDQKIFYENKFNLVIIHNTLQQNIITVNCFVENVCIVTKK